MRSAIAIMAVFAALLPAQAEERHPLVSKAIELAVAGRVVAAKCPGWSINPQVPMLAAMAAGFAGQQAALDAVREEEIQALTEQAKVSSFSSPADCAELANQVMPDPFAAGKTLSVFLHSQN